MTTLTAVRRSGRTAGAPRYKAIADELKAEIRQGRFPIGGLLPSEGELGERFDVGRHTIRDAVRVLVEDGLVLRRPGDGTKVVATARQRSFVKVISNFDQWNNLPDGTTRRNVIAENIVADSELAATIQCGFGAALFHIRSLRFPCSATVPISAMDIYVPPRFAGIAKLPDHLHIPIHARSSASTASCWTRSKWTCWPARSRPTCAPSSPRPRDPVHHQRAALPLHVG